ncbi:MAG: MFS transporter [Halieaceae bacterium]|nr:MFS transporter [Halieaceae bacterium]
MESATDESPRRNTWLRRTLAISRKEAVASAVMTATCDNYLGAFAVTLRASLLQMGWLSALPQLSGAASQLLSVWLSPYFSRRRVVVSGVIVQALAVFGMMLVALLMPAHSVAILIGLAVVYQVCANFVQPLWRGWMGSVVPPRRRGAFFAGRTQLTMLTVFAVFAGGGILLGAFEKQGIALQGFALLFLLAGIGRSVSAWHLHRMHDPDPAHEVPTGNFAATARRIRDAFRHRTFSHYSLFVASMQGAVAVSAPFFSVYMLRDLQFSYWLFSINTGVSIITQFFTLAAWGRVCDQWGNRIVMVTSSLMLPVIPALWLVSPNFFYLCGIQVLSGIAWGGFTLSTANYIYDLRPPRADFASYAAVQSSLGAVGIFLGALAGGFLATGMADYASVLPDIVEPTHPVVLIFLFSACLRLAIVCWFIPHLKELRVREHPGVMQIIYRVSRFTPGAGVVLDWLTVSRKKR